MKIIILLVVFTAIFAAVFSLYDLQVEAVAYAAILSAAAGAVLFAVGFLQFRKRHMELKSLIERASVEVEDMPAPKSLTERDYQEVIRRLFEEKSRVESESQLRYSELTEYYTLWAHQIKTPIAALRLLLSEREEAEELRAELFRIEQYVEMVLQYLRLESDSTDYVIRRCGLDGIVRACLRKYARLFITKRLSLDFRQTGLTVLTDEKWLSFVIEQLLDNALKYTREGRISIYAEGEALIIEDTGIGIRPEDLPRVCEKGFTGYNGRADKRSTGIGLYLCKRVLGKLGHSLRLESEPGKGTKVTVDLSEM